MSTLTKHDGYLMIDHRASPGIPPEVARQLGLDPHQVGEGKVLETSTLSCSHCGGVVMLNPARRRERAYCHKCDHYICDGCAFLAAQPTYMHLPYRAYADRVVDLAEKGVILGSPYALLFPST